MQIALCLYPRRGWDRVAREGLRGKSTGRRQGFLRRQYGQPIGLRPAGQVMGIHGMGDRLETEEVGLIRGRIEDVGRERRIGFNLKLEAPAGPQDGSAAVPAEEGVVDPARRKRARGGEVPLGAGGSGASPAGR